jgi:signal transduction histidine kinase
MVTDRLPSGPLRSAAFRFALLLAFVFATGTGLLLATVERQIGRYAVEATRGTLQTESIILAGEYRELGRSGLIDAMERHGRAGDEAQFRYSLTKATGARLFGDLPPATARAGWGTTAIAEHENGFPTQETFTQLGTMLPDGLLLVVATDNFDVNQLRAQLVRFTLFSGLAITLFALFGGYVIGLVFLRRLDRVNCAVDLIVDGNRTERLPAIGFGPEFDGLTRNLNRMLDRNAAAMEALRQVSNDIAHDLRTPLTRLHQGLERMRDLGTSDPAGVDDALDQTTGLLVTFQALLRIGTVEGGVGRRRFAQVDLSELMDRIYQAYQPVAEDAEHILIADHAEGVFVEGDEALLAQMITNLIENAIVHTPGGTTITASLQISDTAATMEVRDTGTGIPAVERANVFRRFYRLDASRHTEGAGLGLALVAAIAGLHGAEHDIPDTAQGLCVRIRFPRRPAA